MLPAMVDRFQPTLAVMQSITTMQARMMIEGDRDPLVTQAQNMEAIQVLGNLGDGGAKPETEADDPKAKTSNATEAGETTAGTDEASAPEDSTERRADALGSIVRAYLETLEPDEEQEPAARFSMVM